MDFLHGCLCRVTTNLLFFSAPYSFLPNRGKYAFSSSPRNIFLSPSGVNIPQNISSSSGKSILFFRFSKRIILISFRAMTFVFSIYSKNCNPSSTLIGEHSLYKKLPLCLCPRYPLLKQTTVQNKRLLFSENF
jgi:hypothetical protein